MAERFLKVWEGYSKYLKVFADETKGCHFQTKLIKALKKVHRELFAYSDTDVEDDSIKVETIRSYTYGDRDYEVYEVGISWL